ncbi:MAG: septum formation protein Maf [Gammaproteobacteria bacterium]|nr:septum formation protein Maf [Gammaproteobacteria bacterium]
MPATPQLILASSSPYRRILLERLTRNFHLDPPELDESGLPNEPVEARVKRLAVEKAEAVAIRHAGALVIGCDQLAACDGKILGKPGNQARALDQLAAVSGRSVVFHTAVCLLDTRDQRHYQHLDTTNVRFRKLLAAEIDRYLNAEQPYDCAGSFRSEALGVSLLDAIESEDPTALIGLPLIALCRMLRACGLPLP